MANEVDIVVRSQDRTNVNSIAQGFRAKLNSVMERSGKESGSKLQSGFRDALARKVLNAAALLPLLGTPILAAAPIIGAMAAGGLVLAFGAGLAGLGLMFAAKNKEVQQAFSGTVEHINKTMTQISKPFEGVMMHINHVFRNVFDGFVPYLSASFKALAGPLKELTNSIGQGLMTLAPAIKPITDAFIALTRALAPTIPGIVQGIANGIIAVANSIQKNPDTFVSLIQFFGKIVEYGLRLVAFLNGTLAPAVTSVFSAIIGWVRQNQATLKITGLVVGQALAMMAARFLQFGSIVIGMWGTVIEWTGRVVASILNAASAIIGGLVRAFGWIPGIGDKLRAAQRAVDAFKVGVQRSFDQASGAAKRVSGSMATAASKLDTVAGAARRARDGLNAVKSKTVTVTVKDAASATLLGIRRNIESVRGKTVSVNVYYHQRVIGAPPAAGGARPAVAGFAHGGVAGAATGGPRSNWTMVGEHGRELVKLAPGSTVMSNPGTERMMASGAGAGVPVVLEIRSSGKPADDFLAEMIRRYVRIKGNGNVQTAFGR